MNWTPADEQKLDEIARLMDAAKSVLVITGAGMSADSGLPTYRGVGGLYVNGRTARGFPVQEALSGEMFANHPEIVWEVLCELERAARGADFHNGHAILAKWEQQRFPRLWILTQNVDGFHALAGSRQVIDIHGDLSVLYCVGCGDRRRVDDYSMIDPVALPPRCSLCQGVIRPDVVLFDEHLPHEKVQKLRNELRTGFDIVFAIGTTSQFPYILHPLLSAHREGVPTVEINPDDTEISSIVNYHLRKGAKETLEAIDRRLSSS